jgi:hypothetical protein
VQISAFRTLHKRYAIHGVSGDFTIEEEEEEREIFAVIITSVKCNKKASDLQQ